jgi:hypothetical protein
MFFAFLMDEEFMQTFVKSVVTDKDCIALILVHQSNPFKPLEEKFFVFLLSLR